MTDYITPPKTQIGHIHLKVSDLDRALDFYQGVLGFELMARIGNDAAFLSAGGYHHHIGLNTWHSKGKGPAPVNAAGLYHTAFLYPERKDLAAIVKRVLDLGINLDGASDHGVSEAFYLHDPDQNGVELYWDRPQQDWPKDAAGNLTMYNKPINLDDLLSELDHA